MCSQGGKSARIVECVLALKSYREWKQSGGSGTWRYIVNSKPTTFGIAKQYKRKDSEALVDAVTNSPSNTQSNDQRLFDQSDSTTKHEVSELYQCLLLSLIFLKLKISTYIFSFRIGNCQFDRCHCSCGFF